jgi:hypothetical protein
MRNEDNVKNFFYEVERCRMTASKPVLKAPVVSALEP